MSEFSSHIESFNLSPLMLEQLNRYKTLLQEYSQKINLTTIVSDEGIEEKHFYDSLLILPLIESCETVCDVGTGAGFPGMVLAIARPHIHFTLCEPTGKKIRFLEQIREQLVLDNVTLINQRAEQLALEARESFDAVVSRAVAPLPVLCELCVPLVKLGGVMIAMKGPGALQELEQAEHALNVLGIMLETDKKDQLYGGDQRNNLVFRKIQVTSLKYPRTYDRIKKQPL